MRGGAGRGGRGEPERSAEPSAELCVADARDRGPVRAVAAQLLRQSEDGLRDGLRRGHGGGSAVRHLLVPQVRRGRDGTGRDGAQRSRPTAVGGAGGVAAAPGAPEQVRAEPLPCARRRRAPLRPSAGAAPPLRPRAGPAGRRRAPGRGAALCLGAAPPGGAQR